MMSERELREKWIMCCNVVDAQSRQIQELTNMLDEIVSQVPSDITNFEYAIQVTLSGEKIIKARALITSQGKPK